MATLPRSASLPGIGLRSHSLRGGVLVQGISVAFVSLMVLLPMAALLVKATGTGWSGFWQTLTFPANVSALELTVGVSAVIVAINVVFGTLIAWVLVRDEFPGKTVVNAVIDLPFALPTVVAGVTIIALYGPQSPFRVNVEGTRVGIALALLFVTLPFVARSVQPVLIALERDMEEAAAVLGATRPYIFRKIVLPNLAPALAAGAGLAFARALGEYGSVVIVSSNLPGKTQVMSLVIFGYINGFQIGQAAALSLVLLVLSLTVIVFFGWVSRRLGTFHEI